MKKSEVLEAGKQFAKIYLKKYYEDLNPNNVVVVGLKEYTDEYIMIFGIENNYDTLCQVHYDKNNRKVKTEIFKKFNN